MHKPTITVAAFLMAFLGVSASLLAQTTQKTIVGPAAVQHDTPASRVTPASAPAPGDELALDLGNNVTMKLAHIPAGKFTMGSPDGEKGRSADEGPQREVTITKPFCMGATEVTQAQYRAVMGKNPSDFKWLEDPVEQVSWNDAVDFCKKLSEMTGKKVRLPTEAEWEYACRAGTTTMFSFGDDDADLRDYAWYAANNEHRPQPVGRKKPNAWGLYDMHGNVWEWCSDWRADLYVNAKQQDPQGPDSGSARVLRGGCWLNDLSACRSAFRRWHSPGNRFDYCGFRVSVDME